MNTALYLMVRNISALLYIKQIIKNIGTVRLFSDGVWFDYWIYWTLPQPVASNLQISSTRTTVLSYSRFTRRCFVSLRKALLRNGFHKLGFLRSHGTDGIENTTSILFPPFSVRNYYRGSVFTEPFSSDFEWSCHNIIKRNYFSLYLWRKYVGLYRPSYVSNLSVLEQNDGLSKDSVWTLC
jgi:hypothetical protein